MAFKHEGTLTPFGAPVKVALIGTDSQVFTELDSIKTILGFATVNTAGVNVYGHVIAIRTKEGVGLETTGAAGAASGTFVGTYTVASTNESTEKVKVELDVSKNSLYSAEVDATIGTTTGSDLIGYFIDLTDEDTLDENTAATTAAQYATHGISVTNSANALVSIYESNLFGPLAA